MKYNDNRVNLPVPGKSSGYPQWYADMVGFSNDVRPLWVQPAEKPPASLEGCVAPSVPLPKVWNHNLLAWSDGVGETGRVSAGSVWWLCQSLLVSAVFVAGVVVGKRLPRASDDD